MEFNTNNIKLFAPFIKLYASYVSLNGATPASTFLNIFMNDVISSQQTQSIYINNLLTELQKV